MARVASPPKLGYAHGGVAQGRGSAIADHPEPSVLAPHTQPAGVLCHYRELVIKAQWILTGNWGATRPIDGKQWIRGEVQSRREIPGPTVDFHPINLSSNLARALNVAVPAFGEVDSHHRRGSAAAACFLSTLLTPDVSHTTAWVVQERRAPICTLQDARVRVRGGREVVEPARPAPRSRGGRCAPMSEERGNPGPL
jgi:hypothetical protein